MCEIIYTIIVAGLRIELNGQTYANNTAISITEVGEDDNAVLCRTDLTTCCGGTQGDSGQGDWIYPNGTEVGNRADIFRTREDMDIRLHRMHNVVAPTGQYCCEVPTVDDPNARTCITLSKVLKSLTQCQIATTYDVHGINIGL